MISIKGRCEHFVGYIYPTLNWMFIGKNYIKKLVRHKTLNNPSIFILVFSPVVMSLISYFSLFALIFRFSDFSQKFIYFLPRKLNNKFAICRRDQLTVLFGRTESVENIKKWKITPRDATSVLSLHKFEMYWYPEYLFTVANYTRICSWKNLFNRNLIPILKLVSFHIREGFRPPLLFNFIPFIYKTIIFIIRILYWEIGNPISYALYAILSSMLV